MGPAFSALLVFTHLLSYAILLVHSRILSCAHVALFVYSHTMSSAALFVWLRGYPTTEGPFSSTRRRV